MATAEKPLEANNPVVFFDITLGGASLPLQRSHLFGTLIDSISLVTVMSRDIEKIECLFS